MEIDTEIPEWIIAVKKALKEKGIEIKDLLGKKEVESKPPDPLEIPPWIVALKKALKERGMEISDLTKKIEKENKKSGFGKSL